MFLFSTITLLNSLTDKSGLSLFNEEDNTLLFKGGGLYQVDEDHLIEMFKNEGHKEYRDIVDITNLEEMISDPTKIYRIEFYIESNTNADPLFSNSLSRKSKTVFVEFNSIDSFYVNLNRFLTMTYGSQLLNLVGELDGEIADGKSTVTSANKTNQNNYLMASNCYIRVMNADVLQADDNGKFYSIGKLDIYHGSEGLGTQEDILKNYILPTGYNNRLSLILTTDLPLNGALYDLFIIRYFVNRGNLGIHTVGLLTITETLHCFWINLNESLKFELTITLLINSKGGSNKGPKMLGLYYNEDTDLFDFCDYYLGDPVEIQNELAKPLYLILTEEQRNKLTRVFGRSSGSVFDSDNDPEMLKDMIPIIDQEFINSDNAFSSLDNYIGYYICDFVALATGLVSDETAYLKYIYDGVEYEITPSSHDYSQDYFTIVSLEDNNDIKFKCFNPSSENTSSQPQSLTIYVSIDNGTTWTEKTSSTSETIIATLNTDDKLLIKGNNPTYVISNNETEEPTINLLKSTKTVNVEGNIMSLVYGDNFSSQSILTEPYTFASLFGDALFGSQHFTEEEAQEIDNHYRELIETIGESEAQKWYYRQVYSRSLLQIVSAKNLILPNNLTLNCYTYLFSNNVFLEVAPELPATTLTEGCYNSMFLSCTSLTTAPELPATTLANSCYSYMFYGCINLNYIKCLATDISADNCTTDWVLNVSATGTFIRNSLMEDWTIGNNGIPTGWDLIPLHDYSQDYLTFTALEDTTFTFNNLGINDSEYYGYSLDGGQTWNNNSLTPIIHTGEKVLLKLDRINGTNSDSDSDSGSGSGSGSDEILNFSSSCVSSTGKFEVSGNIMSLLFGDNFIGQTSLSGKAYAFLNLFSNNNQLVNAENLILPATELADYCYASMFEGCTALTTAPQLPATTLSNSCYSSMFLNCTSLTTVPKLPATTLADYCYQNMFNGCKSLTETPQLPATTLANSCYSNMFYGCTKLTTAPKLPATTLADHCYSSMFLNCTSLTTAPQLPATTLAQSCYNGMFYNCTSLTTAPELPATTLADHCYDSMFLNCTSLTTAPELPATTLANSCYSNMFQGCTSLTTAPQLPVTTLANSCYSNMFRGCTSLTTAPQLPATTLADECYRYMFYDCTKLTTAPKLPATTLTPYCYSSMFNGCSALTTALELPATTLADHCYASMFLNCTSLTTAPELPATTLANSCYSSMFLNCTSLTTVPKLPATTLANYCYQNMFNGCKSLTETPQLPATTLANDCYASMFEGCTALTTAPQLPATTLSNSCYSSMFLNCTSLTTAPELPATTLANSCYSSMFLNCISLTTAPQLPATTLANHCYDSMFLNCSQLNYIKCLATNISASDCTTAWVQGVSATGTFVRANNMNNWTTGNNGIPSGWESTYDNTIVDPGSDGT